MPWPLPESDDALLALARSYPFAAPGGCYLFRAGAPHPLAPDPGAFDGRVPVIAHGSNRSPDQLRRKYGRSAEIPVTRAWLSDYDVVYSAHLTRYGAVAANLQHSPGTRAQVHVTWLDEGQLARMHETELGGEIYVYGRMDGIELALDSGPAATVETAFVYLSTRGCLLDGVGPIGLAEVAAEARAHGALHQADAQALVRDRHRPGADLDALILEVIRRPATRRALIEEMGAGAVPLAAPHFRQLAP